MSGDERRRHVWLTVDRHALTLGWTALAASASLFLQLWEIFK